MSENKEHQNSEDSAEQRLKKNDPERDISPQREDNSRPKRKK
ncbi:hypothetical protein [Halobacillus naozhouensis]|uniref:Biofilm-forming protein n=1 Tax=Halobacillus naozhouensis TaxID=554880 RepID=A0ABY8J3U0_9BACI|nr:hypothetical protein [Halobacillus naozhouensis]WFT75531.1 hypothetical protein P9989_03820 [Halobacillus naozhouensis]